MYVTVCMNATHVRMHICVHASMFVQACAHLTTARHHSMGAVWIPLPWSGHSCPLAPSGAHMLLMNAISMSTFYLHSSK